ncbi:MAG: hypothetical protein KC442_09500, partial [Thermomicrobiales bacterium]|nr:hypothetical protein [Thermomicrobiales bacterium]
SNFVLANPPEDQAIRDAVPQEELAARTARQAYMADEVGYQQIQGTKPQSVGVALNDSPAGLAAWIAEKFHEWADPRSPIDRDRLLTNVSLYWYTRTAGSSARIYYESAQGRGSPNPCPVPMGVAVFPYDILQPVRSFAERVYDIRHWSEFDRGGHFAALEAPGLLTEDVRAFFRPLRR